jgi:release factor glutamine methyltransferase
MELGQLRDELARALQARYEPREAEAVVRQLLAYLWGCPPYEVSLHYREAVSEALRTQARYAQDKLLQGYPLQHLTGQVVFMDLELSVGPEVLIPRPETEELVQWVIDDWAPHEDEYLKIADVGTGSGCIALALAGRFDRAEVWASDLSAAALETARYNALRLGLPAMVYPPPPTGAADAAIKFVQWDLLQQPGWAAQLPELDLLVSNPPYITEQERDQLDEHVRAHEPPEALFVPDRDPIVFYRALAQLAKQKLKKRGALYVEVHPPYAEEARKAFKRAGLRSPELRQDLQGRPRMLKAGAKTGWF